jgi:hypothetical protein
LNSTLLIKTDKRPSAVLCNGKTYPYSWDSKEGLINIKPEKNIDVKFVIIP